MKLALWNWFFDLFKFFTIPFYTVKVFVDWISRNVVDFTALFVRLTTRVLVPLLNNRSAVLTFLLMGSSGLFYFAKEKIPDFFGKVVLSDVAGAFDVSLLDKFVDFSLLTSFCSTLFAYLIVYYGVFVSGVGVFLLTRVLKLIRG